MPEVWGTPARPHAVHGLVGGDEFRFSATPTCTRDVDILPEGHRLVNGDSRCALGYQGLLTCGRARIRPGGHLGRNWWLALGRPPRSQRKTTSRPWESSLTAKTW